MGSRIWRPVAGLVAGFVCCWTVFGAQTGATPYADVLAAVRQWVDGMDGKVYTATIRSSDGVSPLRGKRVNDRLFEFQDGDVRIGIGFNIAPEKNSTLEELRSAFNHIALDRIPVPGVKTRNWETRLQTSTSSFKNGVTLESWKDGVLKARVQVQFFAAYGRRTDVAVPADARMPEETYFQIRKPIKADLTIEGRLF
ncbi:MAG TPA: hypothetical protein VFY29_21080 [Terriglobia bacterium]|nr:hypothetical protein [Terriglobia bacterium]